MVGIMYILLFWLIGNALSSLIDGMVSGNVIGMVLLFAALKFRLLNPDTIRPAAKFLTANMAVCFVPFGVGLIISYRVIADNLWAILVAAAVSTVLVIISTGHVMQWMYKAKDKHCEK